MNKNLSARRGSALLVVLGMIAFMVVSAVAFSAYMRYSRMPSSYLRRTSASRHLVHAAIANAIDYVDASIGANPHPGLGSKESTYDDDTRSRTGGDTCNRNYWRDHCFIGTNRLVEADETVSVLTLEALAYIPPSLINEARYYSRHVPTARWRDFGYDSGRFAFFAIDVSDYLNVNMLSADCGRSSADGGKFTLAYAFENESHNSYTVQPSQWDSFIEQFIDLDDPTKETASKMRFISLADLNLAVYNKNQSLAQYVSPFCAYLEGGVNLDNIQNVKGAETMKLLNIVTDGYYPTPTVDSDGEKLEKEGNLAAKQPFKNMVQQDNATQIPNRQILQMLTTDGPGQILSDEMTGLDLIALYDYLDCNDTPASLALPSVERVPMICGIQPAVKLQFKPQKTEGTPQPDNDETVGVHTRVDSFTLEIGGNGTIDMLYMFPFRRDGDIQVGSEKGETAVRIGLSIGDGPKLRTRSDSGYVVQDESDFGNKGVANSMIMPEVRTTSNLSKKNIKQPSETLTQTSLTMRFDDVRSWSKQNPVFTVTHQYNVIKDEGTGKLLADKSSDKIIDAAISADFHPLDANGVKTTDGGFNKATLMSGGKVTVRPYMTITSRITKNGKTVDLAPASCLDDQKYNGVNSDRNIANIGGGGSGTQPVLSFAGDKELEFSIDAFEKGDAVEVTLKPSDGNAIFCPDPRWNFAPENFIQTSKTLDGGQSYLDMIGLGKEGRDADPFMFCSNQGYMQSISELAFLPRTVVGDRGTGRDIEGDCVFTMGDWATYAKADNCDNLNAINIPHAKMMWRTYRLYKMSQGSLKHDDLYDLGIYDGGKGPRVSPYTDSEEVLLAALANTPYDWWAASTNDNLTAKKAMEDLDAKSFNSRYAFSPMNSDAKLGWKDLEKIAEKLKTAMRTDTTGDWEKGYEDLDWAGDQGGDLFGLSLGDSDELYEIDRKFLYGFWRDCFAARQQLFLVFARAEPTMMGGGAVGQTPPQLGARAMALVWRSPSANGATGTNPPHRTRILFYRQFD